MEAEPRGARGRASPELSWPAVCAAPDRHHHPDSGKPVIRLLKFFLLLALLLPPGLYAVAQWWLGQPLPLRGGEAAGVLEVDIPPGSSARAVADRLNEAGVAVPAPLLYAWFRWSGQARDIKAGTYDVPPGITPASLLDKLVRGEQALRSVQILEGWTAKQAIEALRRAPDLTQDLDGLTPAQVMALIGRPGVHPEGRFFPDTYRVARRARASSVLAEAARAMDRRLADAWAQRDPAVPLKSPDEALILASIVEKETGLDGERRQIAGVFANRLRIGMRLQTDPSVIYGLGARFDGDIRRNDLATDTPYNTYTRAGLPPTPIALPGMASLMAAVQPEPTRALYFVSRGDGSSHFSATLDEHNAAVRRYILRR